MNGAPGRYASHVSESRRGAPGQWMTRGKQILRLLHRSRQVRWPGPRFGEGMTRHELGRTVTTEMRWLLGVAVQGGRPWHYSNA